MVENDMVRTAVIMSNPLHCLSYKVFVIIETLDIDHGYRKSMTSITSQGIANRQIMLVVCKGLVGSLPWYYKLPNLLQY